MLSTRGVHARRVQDVLDEERAEAARSVQASVRGAKARREHERWQRRNRALKAHEANVTLAR